MAHRRLLFLLNTRWLAALLTLASCGAASEPSEDFAQAPEDLRLPTQFSPPWWHGSGAHSVCPFVSLAATPQNVATVGELVTIQASAKCWPHATPEYLIWYRAPESSWRVLQRYSSETSYAWETANAAPGMHTFRVWARARGSHDWFQAVSDIRYRLLAQCQAPAVSFAPSAAAPGTDVTISVAATCGGEPEYEFRVRAAGSPDTPWTVLQAWSPNVSTVWSTGGLPLGDYEVQVAVRNHGSGAESQTVAASTYQLQPVCGDGHLDGDESCDLQDLGGATCATATAGAKPVGDLACDASCRLDTSRCSSPLPPDCLQLSYSIPTTVTTLTRHGGADTASWCDAFPSYSTRTSSYASEISLAFANGAWSAIMAAQFSALALASDSIYRASFYGAIQTFEVNCTTGTATVRGQVPETRIGMCDHVSEFSEGTVNFGGSETGGSQGSGGTSGAGGSAGSGGTVAGGSSGAGGSPGSSGGSAWGGQGGQSPCPEAGGSMRRMPEGYCIDRKEVTLAQYAAWLATSPPLPDAEDRYCGWQQTEPWGGWQPGAGEGDDYPVYGVTWCDAAGYCGSFGKRLCGRIGGGPVAPEDANDPTTSEWFSACSAHGQYTFVYGNTYEDATCSADASFPPSRAVVPVGSMIQCQSPDQQYAGIFDLNGNIAEWDDSCSDETCWARGGAVSLSPENQFSCAWRVGFSSDNPRAITFPMVGFRCCAD